MERMFVCSVYLNGGGGGGSNRELLWKRIVLEIRKIMQPRKKAEFGKLGFNKLVNFPTSLVNR